MERLIKEHFTGYLHKIDPKDIRGKEVALWSILLLNLLGFFLNIFSENLIFLLNMVGVTLMMLSINNYYRHER
jgi:hypothetical protein